MKSGNAGLHSIATATLDRVTPNLMLSDSTSQMTNFLSRLAYAMYRS
jgi:hypothetical protein